MNGKIYYNSPNVAMESGAYGYYCVDLYSGEQIWYKNGTDNGLNNPYNLATGLGSRNAFGTKQYPYLAFGQLYHWYGVNGQGVIPYLWMQPVNTTSTWYMIDPATGNWILTLVNVPSGTAVTDQDGSLLQYSYNSNTGNLLCWNSSQALPPSAPLGTGQQQWKLRLGATIDAVADYNWKTRTPTVEFPAEVLNIPTSGYTMNVTIDKKLPGSLRVLQDANRVPKQIFGSTVPTKISTGSTDVSEDYFSVWLVDIKEHATGYSPYPQYTATQNTNLGFAASVLWNKNITVPITGKDYTWSVASASYNDQIFVLACKQTMQFWGYSLKDGSLLWGPTPAPFDPMEYYSSSISFYYGKAFHAAYGTVYAYDTQTGALVWTYNDTAPAYESPYGDNFPTSISAVCDGKIYLTSSEHSPSKPLWRPWLVCLNATDGTEMWKLQYYKGFGGGISLADGYIVVSNTEDNLIYCLGKGPSATTVSAPPTGMPMGSTYVISGTVSDISPGAMASGHKFGYTNGLPAVSDVSQQAWMEYIYEQQEKPTNVTGVQVSIDAIDPNNNYVHIGDATTDASGTFGYAWTTPDVPGQYAITATFMGSSSYGGSSAQAYAYVGEAAPTTSPSTLGAQQPTEMYIIGAAAAIIIAIVLVGAVLLLAIRKRA